MLYINYPLYINYLSSQQGTGMHTFWGRAYSSNLSK
jgi:hypothetical protein